jgi:adenosylhomocysteine nucleosidase
VRPNVPDSRPIAFVGATAREIRPLVRRLSLRHTTFGVLGGYGGALDGRPVVAAATGMGTKLAGAGTEHLLQAIRPSRVIVVGVTGAVDRSSEIGTLIIPAVVVDAVTGVEYRPDLSLAGAAGVAGGTLWTSDALVTDAVELASLAARGVVALDMETAAIAEVCQRHGVGWVVVRAVSDRAGDGGLDEEVLGLSHADGTPDPWAVAKYLVRRPGRIPRLIGLARAVSVASDRAADWAIGHCGSG